MLFKYMEELSHKNIVSLFSQHENWPEVRKIILTLNKAGKIAYLAGGCVRDALLNRTPKDFDIATSARPEEILRLFPGSNKQGKVFGVVAVFCSKGPPVEVATFRKDGPYTDGRHPDYVKFLSEKEDALRRDFTVNALFYNVKTDELIDYVGGTEDLRKKIIRSVGDPEKRFQEDHLRILRAVRFSLKLNFKIESLTETALFQMKDTLLKLSRERIYEECLKILKTKECARALSTFKKLGLLQQFWPLSEKVDWKFCLNFWSSVFPESLVSSKLPVSYGDLMNDKYFLWSQVFYPLLIQKEQSVLNRNGKWNKDFSRNLKEWKFPVTLIRSMNDIFYSSCCLLNIRKASFGKKLRMLNSDFSGSILFLSRYYLKNKKLKADIINEMEREFKIRAPDGQLAEPLVNGNDLKALGILEDKNMAHILEYLYELQLEQQIKEKKRLLEQDFLTKYIE